MTSPIRANSAVRLFSLLDVPSIAGLRILDLRCGDGQLCRMAADLGADATGLVPTPDNPPKTTGCDGRLTILNHDWRDLKPGLEFDVIFLRNGLHLEERPSELISGVRRMLSDSGVFVVEDRMFHAPYPLWLPGEAPYRYPTHALWENGLLSGFSFRKIAGTVADRPNVLQDTLYLCRPRVATWTLVSGPSNSGKSDLARSLQKDGRAVHLDWILGECIARIKSCRNSNLLEVIDILNNTRDLSRVVSWIDSTEKAEELAAHVIAYFPTDIDLIIEGALLTNRLFIQAFTAQATLRKVRTWSVNRHS